MLPVDYENTFSDKGKARIDLKYQLVAYALLVKENFGVVVKRGFVNYILETLIIQLEITPAMKRVIEHINLM